MPATREPASLYASTADPSRVVEYRIGGTFFNALPVWLILFATALAIIVFGADRSETRLAAWAMLLLTSAGFAFAFWRGRPSAPADLLLAPQGLALRFNGVIAVPWSMVRAIETRSFEGYLPRYRGRQRIRFDNVTMIRVPPGFLESERQAGRFGTFDPTTDWVIRPAEGGDWIALHHEFFGLTPAELRGPVQARWQAFGDGSAPPNPCALPPLRLGGFRPKNPPLFMLGTAVGLTAILILSANLAGLWETRAQASARTGWTPPFAGPSAEDIARRRELDRTNRARSEEDRRLLGIPEPVDIWRPAPQPPPGPAP
jgi:hypothetical protein